MKMELKDNELDAVTGGALVWDHDTVYPLTDPTCKYSVTSYDECREYIKNNWTGGPQNEDALKMLEAAGLVTKIV